MPVRTQKVQVPLGGIDTESDKRLVAPGSLLEAENVELDSTGAARKRNGFQNLGLVSTSAGKGICRTGDFITFNDINGNRYSESTGLFRYGFSYQGFPPFHQCTVKRLPCGKYSRSDAWCATAAYDGSKFFVAWFEQDAASATEVYLITQIIDAETGVALATPSVAHTFGISSGISAFGQKAFLDVTAYDGEAFIVATVEDASTPTVESVLYELSFNSSTGISATQRDLYNYSGSVEKVRITNDGTDLYLYAKLDATTASQPLHKRTIVSPAAISSSLSPSGVTGPADVVHVFSDSGYVFCCDGTNFAVYQDDFSTLATSGALASGAYDYVFSMGEDPVNRLMLGCVANGNGYRGLSYSDSGYAGQIQPDHGSTAAFPEQPIAGFKFDDYTSILVCTENRATSARAQLVVSHNNAPATEDGLRAIGAFAYGEADYKRNSGATNIPIATACSMDSATKFAFAGVFAIADDPEADNPNNLTYAPCVYVVERVKRPKAVEFAGSSIMGPGFLSAAGVDGSLGQVGFSEIPKCELDADSTSGGNLVNGSIYQVALMYERTDGGGRVHRSPPSAILSHEIPGGASSNSFTVEFCNAAESSNGAAKHAMVSDDRENTYLVAYRSLENGSVLYRESETKVTSTTTTVTIGTETEANLATAEQLYTTGGVVETMPPPSCTDFTRAGRRLFALSSEYLERCYFTQEEQQGIGPEFSPFLYVNIDTGNGAPTGIASMDGRVIVFYDRAIAYFSGFGPDRRGVGAFSDVTVLPSDVGCVNWQSIAKVPSGIVFKSRKGIRLLDRSMNVVDIGSAVSAYDGNNVERAISALDDDKCLFLLDDLETILVWRYESNQWTTYKTEMVVKIGDLAELDGKVYALTNASGYLLQEDPDTLDDYTTDYTMKITTPWISTAGLQGFQRVKWIQLVGEYEGAHTIQVKTYYDYDDTTAVQTLTKTVSSDPNDYDLRFKPSRQKCKAIKIEITDVTPDSSGKSFKLSGIELEIGVKGGVSKNGPAPAVT